MIPSPLPRLSANALKELDRCERKFALKYIKQAFWPGTPPEEREAGDHIGVGQAFHLLVQVHTLGLDVAPTLAALADEAGRLAALWQAFSASVHVSPPGNARLWTEQQLNFFVEGVPYNVRYDRVMEQNGAWTILDWKTGRVDPSVMLADWQTRLYRYALVTAGLGLGRGAVPPDAVTLIYWQVEGARPLELRYDAATYAADHEVFVERAARVRQPFDARAADDTAYPKDVKHCRACSYHSMCHRESEPTVARVEITRRPRFVVHD